MLRDADAAYCGTDTSVATPTTSPTPWRVGSYVGRESGAAIEARVAWLSSWRARMRYAVANSPSEVTRRKWQADGAWS